MAALRKRCRQGVLVDMLRGFLASLEERDLHDSLNTHVMTCISARVLVLLFREQDRKSTLYGTFTLI